MIMLFNHVCLLRIFKCLREKCPQGLSKEEFSWICERGEEKKKERKKKEVESRGKRKNEREGERE